MSDIEWTDETWNPVAGCNVISPGCTNCYAMRMAARLQAMEHRKYVGTTRKSGKRAVWTGKIVTDRGALDIPKRWKHPRRVFVNSMSDLFHEKVDISFISDVWSVMRETPQHTYQILTKRPGRMAEILKDINNPVLPNVWLGCSVESQEYVERIDDLRDVPAAIRFLSLEPLLGPLDRLNLDQIGWVIVGGESGPGARPMEEEWVHSIRDQCAIAEVPFFFKQWGGRNKKKTGRSLSGFTYDQYPEPSIS